MRAGSLLIIITFACLASCGAKKEEREQNSSTPRESPSAEYPGSKENDSIWKSKNDSANIKGSEK